MRNRLTRPLIAAFALAAILAGGIEDARALESNVAASPRSQASIVSETDSFRPGVPFRIGLRLRLAPGWHSYWQNPGDAGAPPELTLALSDGASAGPMQLPIPTRIEEGPLVTYGYTGARLLPVTITPGLATGALHLQAEANWLSCERICIPEHGKFDLTIPVGTGVPGQDSLLFTRADAWMPMQSPFSARFAPDGMLSLEGEGLGPDGVRHAWFAPASSGLIDNAAPQALQLAPGKLTLKLNLADGIDAGAPLRGLVIVEDAGGRTTGLQIAATPGPVAASNTGLGVTGTVRALGFAFLAGLILNLMPCVFPVLAMKAVALARLSGASRRTMRMEAGSYTLGVLVAFAALGLALIGFRAAGAASGWGFQFQSPAFVAGMAWVIFVIGLNLSGVFAIGGRITGVGQSLAVRGGHLGSFFTGLLAVVVATPCTAPFMAGAVAAALLAPLPVAIAIFLAMGLGLAAPALIVAAFPRIGRSLPRPGAWMERLRQVMAFPMYATVVWLLWVLSQQVGPDGVLVAGGGLVLLGFAAWCWRVAQTTRGARTLPQAAAVIGLVCALVLLPMIATLAPAPARAADSDSAEAFSPARLAELRASGRPVFVNMTAAWCVTCIVNERMALSAPSVLEAFNSGRVAYLKGDWTRQDRAISDFLRAHGREGVPLYLFYPVGAEAIELPQILTETMLLDLLRGKSGSGSASGSARPGAQG